MYETAAAATYCCVLRWDVLCCLLPHQVNKGYCATHHRKIAHAPFPPPAPTPTLTLRTPHYHGCPAAGLGERALTVGSITLTGSE